MDSAQPDTGVPENAKDFQPEVPQEIDTSASECLKSPNGIEYKGGGAPDPPKNLENGDDVTLEFSDGHSIHFSRRQLAAESHFFRALFLDNFKDSLANTVKLPNISSTKFLSCLSIAYQAAILEPDMPKLPLQTAVNIMPIASQLCMDGVLDLLSNIIHSKVESSSILPAYRTAKDHHAELADRLWKTVIGRFKTLIVNGDHLHLTEDEFVAAFRSEKLNIPSAIEEMVVKDYVKAHPEDHRISKIADNLTFAGDGADTPGVYRNRIPSEVVLSLGGWCSVGPSDIIETYNTRNNKWIASTTFKCDVPRAYHAFNILDDSSFLVCGGMNGREHFRRTSIFDIRTKEWTQLSDMRERRCYITGSPVPNSVHKKLVMVVGGFNGMERLNTCEMFDLDENGWKTITRMRKRRSDYGTVAIGEQVFVVGGFDGRQTHSDVEMYDAPSNRWYPLGRSMHNRRTGVCALALDSNVLLAVGGYDGSRRLHTVEMCDVREGQWHFLPQMNTSRSNFGAQYMDGCVYSVGGYDGVSTTSATERFDLAAQKWEQLPSMNLSKSALKLARITDSDFIRSLIEFDDPQAGY